MHGQKNIKLGFIVVYVIQSCLVTIFLFAFIPYKEVLR